MDSAKSDRSDGITCFKAISCIWLGDVTWIVPCSAGSADGMSSAAKLVKH